MIRLMTYEEFLQHKEDNNECGLCNQERFIFFCIKCSDKYHEEFLSHNSKTKAGYRIFAYNQYKEKLIKGTMDVWKK